MRCSLPSFGHTIADAARKLYPGEAPLAALVGFLNDWWFLGEKERAQRITAPFPTLATSKEKRWAVFWAATVEELCVKISLTGPLWTNQQRYFLPVPWFYYSRSRSVNGCSRQYLNHSGAETFSLKAMASRANTKDVAGTKPPWSG